MHAISNQINYDLILNVSNLIISEKDHALQIVL